MRASRIIDHRAAPAGAVAVALALGLALGGCAALGGAGGALGGLDPEEPPIVLPSPTPTPTPSAADAAEEGGFTTCVDASPAALAAVNASIAADPGPYPGLQLDGLETMWDAEQEVWTLAGMIGPVGAEPGAETGNRVALWATDQDPTRDDFAGTVWSAVNGSDMVSAAPQLESFPQLTMDGPDPAGLWCADLYPEAAGG
ncbi:hypothetical protein CMsap09_00995 [Clavibacter michiganensis]|uniref:Lipoprotein n=1 Tax=Clavibacter michiganensis TaxID=28447 RepID=A0A251XQE7_9MICO|nr:hypothetical protein CMsap09_00995 [Clavibacter michiganensis]